MSPNRQLRDAAIVATSLPRQAMQVLLSHLDEESRQELLDSMDELEGVSGPDLYRASRRFRQSTQPSDPHGDPANPAHAEYDSAESDKLRWPPESLGPREKPFSFLIHLPSAARQHLLETEHPQNVAMVLAVIPPANASAVTRELDPTFRISVIRRLCEIEHIDDAKLMELRYALRLRVNRMLAIEQSTKHDLSVAVNLLSVADPKTRDSTVALLADRDPELGHELRQRILTMDDLENFADHEIGRLLTHVDTSAWAGALRSTKAAVAQLVLKQMDRRAADIVILEMESFDPLDEEKTHWSIEQVLNAAVKIRRHPPTSAASTLGAST